MTSQTPEVNTTEIEEVVENFPYHEKQIMPSGAEWILIDKEVLRTTLLSQQQKHREMWLREEIMKLEGMKIKELPSSLHDTTGFVMGHSKNLTLQTIIDRYQAELEGGLEK